MSFNLTSGNGHRFRFARTNRAGAAFIVEALLLLVFLAAAVAIFVRLFALSTTQAAEAEQLTRAVAAAQSAAERFAAAPDAPPMVEIDGLRVQVSVTPEETPAGTLYHATITVFAAGETADGTDTPLYTLETATYRGGDGA